MSRALPCGLIATLHVVAATALAAENAPANAVWIVPAGATPALKKPSTVHVVGYKREIFDFLAVRLGLDGRYGSSDGAEKHLDVGLAPEFRLHPAKWWILHAGIELGYSTTRYVGRKNYLARWAASPFIGANYFVDEHFSVATEVKLDVHYTQFRDPGAFDPSANDEEWEIALGGVGSLFLMFWF